MHHVASMFRGSAFPTVPITHLGEFSIDISQLLCVWKRIFPKHINLSCVRDFVLLIFFVCLLQR